MLGSMSDVATGRASGQKVTRPLAVTIGWARYLGSRPRVGRDLERAQFAKRTSW